MNSDTNTPSTTSTNHGNAIELPAPQGAQGEPGSPVISPEEIDRLTETHRKAAVLNRVTIRTNFQQAIQDALLDPKGRKDLPTLTATFRQWAEGESLLGLN